MDELMEVFSMLEQSGLETEVLMIVGIVALVFALISGVFSLALYILKAKGIYTIAKRRGIRRAWLAWIPLADYWVAGSLSDQYKHSVKGKSACSRYILPVLAVVSGLVALVSSGVSLGTVTEVIECIMDNDLESIAYAGTLATGSSGLLGLLADGLDIAMLVFWQITLYDIYAAANPRYAVTFLVLGIIFPVTIPFFLFFNRKKDEGMRIPQEPVTPAGYIAGDAGNPPTEYL